MLYKIWWSILFPHHVHSISANRNIYSFVLDQFPFTWLLSHHSLSFVFLLLHWQYHISLPHKLLFLTWIIVTSNALSFSLLINISQSNTITSLLWLWIHYILCHLSNLYHLWTIYLKNLSYYIYTHNFWLLSNFMPKSDSSSCFGLNKSHNHTFRWAGNNLKHFFDFSLSSSPIIQSIIKFCRHYHLNT